MGDKTKIDWSDSTWNPVTGCLHGCEYCYARKIAMRYCANEHGRRDGVLADMKCSLGCATCSEIDGVEFVGNKVRWNHLPNIPYPFGFLPTFHPHRLIVPARWKRPRNIFVCSMADLFGEWIPDSWIREVFKACDTAPQHRYLFLTKNPTRYDRLIDSGVLPEGHDNLWFGTTCVDMTRPLHFNRRAHTFISCEPMLAPWPDAKGHGDLSIVPEWVIFGAETGNRKNKVVPEKKWVDNAVRQCRKNHQKIFMKESLHSLMGSDFIQEYPWEVHI